MANYLSLSECLRGQPMQLTSCASELLGALVGASVGGGGRTCARTDITDCEAVGPRKGISSMSGQGGDAGVPSEQRATAAVARLWMIQMRALFFSTMSEPFFAGLLWVCS